MLNPYQMIVLLPSSAHSVTCSKPEAFGSDSPGGTLIIFPQALAIDADDLLGLLVPGGATTSSRSSPPMALPLPGSFPRPSSLSSPQRGRNVFIPYMDDDCRIVFVCQRLHCGFYVVSKSFEVTYIYDVDRSSS
jgi:hypothetical protein